MLFNASPWISRRTLQVASAKPLPMLVLCPRVAFPIYTFQVRLSPSPPLGSPPVPTVAIIHAQHITRGISLNPPNNFLWFTHLTCEETKAQAH